MVLDRYFKAKSRLKAALPALRSVRARAKGNAGQSVAECVATVEKLREVFRVGVFGVPGSGKTALAEAVKVEAGGRLRVDEFLVTKEGRVPDKGGQCDVLLGVLDAADPWNADLWNALKQIEADQREKLLLVIQRSDLRTEFELQPVLAHVIEKVKELLETNQPVILFSAKKLQLASSEPPDGDSFYQSCGMNQLSAALESTLYASTQCLDAVRGAVSAGSKAIDELRAEMGAVAIDVEEMAAMSKGIEQLGESFIERVPSKLSSLLSTIDRGVMDVILRAEVELLSEAAKGNSEERANEIQKTVTTGTADAVEELLQATATRTEEFLDQSWAHIGRHLEELQGDAFRAKDLKAGSWSKRRKVFLEAGRNRLTLVQKGITVEEPARIQLSRPAAARRNFTLSIIALVVAGAVAAGGFQQWVIAGVCGIALLIPIIIFYRWKKSWKASSVRALWDELDPHREKLESATASVFSEDTTAYTDEFHSRVQRLAAQVGRYRNKKEPALSDFTQMAAALDEARALLSG